MNFLKFLRLYFQILGRRITSAPFRSRMSLWEAMPVFLIKPHSPAAGRESKRLVLNKRFFFSLAGQEDSHLSAVIAAHSFVPLYIIKD